MDILGQRVEFVPVCPEVECGLKVPRPPMQLIKHDKEIRLTIIASGEDQTDLFAAWCRQKMAHLKEQKLAGFILKSRSPSCGVHSTKIFNPSGTVLTTGSGLFAQALKNSLPSVLLAEEEDLHDDNFLKNFMAMLKISSP